MVRAHKAGDTWDFPRFSQWGMEMVSSHSLTPCPVEHSRVAKPGVLLGLDKELGHPRPPRQTAPPPLAKGSMGSHLLFKILDPYITTSL